MEIFTIHPCPNCKHETPLNTSGAARQVKCPACGTPFAVQPMNKALTKALQDAFKDYMARSKPKAKPAPIVPAFCFQLAEDPQRFAFERVLMLDELAKGYASDPAGAERSFKNTKFCVMGVLDEIGIFEAFVSASLTTATGSFTVFCDFIKKTEMFELLEEGDTLCIQGTYQGLLDPANPTGGVFNACTLLGIKGHAASPPGHCPDPAHEIPAKSGANPHNLRIVFSKPESK